MTTIDELRTEIAAIDEELIRLAGKRIDTARRIGELKREQGLDIVVPSVESQVKQRYADGAEKAGVPGKTAEDLADLMIAACRSVQK